MTEVTNRHKRRVTEKAPGVLARIEEAHKSQATELDLSGMQLSELPDSIGQLIHLQSLDLMENQLTSLPESIGELTQLRVLALTVNKLSTLPASLSRLNQLQHLHLSANAFTELPESVADLTQLQHLCINNNQLTVLPSAIRHLTHLSDLQLSGNRLVSLPDFIGELSQLESLILSRNHLTELPNSLGQLHQLQSLDLSGNRLRDLPETLRDLTALKQFFLHQNRGLGLPAEVLGPSQRQQLFKERELAKPSEILEYYFRVRGGRRPLNEAKLILVGRGGVGKTSIVNRIVHNLFKEEKKTEGIKITGWKLMLRGDDNVRLNIWDFGGQEIMHATHQFFLTQRSLYLLVLNGREGGEDADAEYWLKLIESFGADSPIIIVLNKIKEHPFDVNRRALQYKYPSIRDFIKTDCEDGTGLKQLQRAIERETDRLEHLRDGFPSSWFTIKDKLAGTKKNFLSFDEYRKICVSFGEKNQEAQELLAGYLHNLGIALNYKDDPRLQDTHVLNPHWVTNAIYKILNARKLERQKGEIQLRDLSNILDGRKYPVRMHRFIFDLMKKFDLCFSFPNDDTHYLVPELLDKQEAPEAAAFNPQECLNFQYQYTVLPEGLLPRFIVRTHVLSEGLPRWRTGVILRFEDSQALVKADIQDRKIFIYVSGLISSRRRLLAIIRSYFDEIHHYIPRLCPKEMVPTPNHPEVIISYEKLLAMERAGIKKFPELSDGRVVELDVQELLNGVDLQGTREGGRIRMSEMKRAVRLFYSYSHKDETLRNELETHLKLLQRQGWIETWHDRKIDAGDDWKRQIDENLERADIILLLVSASFIASDYCYEKEMVRALERHESGEAKVIPIILRDVNWKIAPFAKLQALPKDAKAVTLWTNKDSAWRNVSEGIEKVAKKMHES